MSTEAKVKAAIKRAISYKMVKDILAAGYEVAIHDDMNKPQNKTTDFASAVADLNLDHTDRFSIYSREGTLMGDAGMHHHAGYESISSRFDSLVPHMQDALKLGRQLRANVKNLIQTRDMAELLSTDEHPYYMQISDFGKNGRVGLSLHPSGKLIVSDTVVCKTHGNSIIVEIVTPSCAQEVRNTPKGELVAL